MEMTTAELNRAIAVFQGWKVNEDFCVSPDGYYHVSIPDFAENIGVSWALVEEMPAPVLYKEGAEWSFSGGICFPEIRAATAPLAICKAYYEWQTNLAKRLRVAAQPDAAPDPLQSAHSSLPCGRG